MTTGSGTEHLERLLEKGEGETIEFKQSFDEEALESVAAFANTKGGSVLIGVADNGEVNGVQLGSETLRDWANRIALSTHLNPRVSSVRLDGKAVGIIEVAESAAKPVPCRGRYFKRVDRSNRQMSDDDLTRAILDKVGKTWDEGVEARASLEDVDRSKLDRFRALCNKEGRRLISDELGTVAVLEKLALVREGKPTRAAVLLFGREPQRFYPSASVKIGRFRSETLIVDDREVGGTLFDQVESTMGYFREHLQTRFEKKGTPARDVIWEYPLAALREAIINAVCHRDYLDVGQTQVRWYDDRLIFLNPGGLPESLSVEKLKQVHASKPRNRKIAEALYYAGLIEKWGSGTVDILSNCRDAGLPEPTFEEEQGGLWVTFRPAKAQAQHVSIHVPTHVTPKATPKVTPEVTPKVRKLLDRARKAASREDLQSAMGLKDMMHFFRSYLEPLLASGWLERTIPGKPTSAKQRYQTTAAGIDAMKATKSVGTERARKRLKRLAGKRDKNGTKGTSKTRHKPAKPAMRAGGGKTRRKPAKPDTRK